MTANVIFLSIVFSILFLAFFRKPIYNFFFKPKVVKSPFGEIGTAGVIILVMLFLALVEGPKQISRKFPFIQGIIFLAICGGIAWWLLK